MLEVDPELVASLRALNSGDPALPVPARGDVEGLRIQVDTRLSLLSGLVEDPPGLERRDYKVPAEDGATLLVRAFQAEGFADGPAALYIHGGGMVAGSVAVYDRFIASLAASAGVQLFAVDYRLAPASSASGPIDDCLSALRWLRAHADEFGIDPARIGLVGDSAGGGIAAALAAREAAERGPLAGLVLLYPMLDDRTQPDPLLVHVATWGYDANATGWAALLGGGPESLVRKMVPARIDELSSLPPTYLEVGQLDIFRDECMAFAIRLSQSGVPCEFHLWPGATHAFEKVAPTSELARRAIDARSRALQRL